MKMLVYIGQSYQHVIKYNRDCNETQSTSTVANYERVVRSAVNLLPKQWQDDTLLNPGGALRYRGGPHLRYVFRGRRGLFKDLHMSAILLKKGTFLYGG